MDFALLGTVALWWISNYTVLKNCRYYKDWKEIKDHDASDNQYILAKLKHMLELLTIDGRLKCKKVFVSRGTNEVKRYLFYGF